MAKKSKAEGKQKQGGSSGQNRKNSDSFLTKHSKKSGVMSTESGLLYEIIIAGEGGDTPSEGANVTVHQRAMLVGGKVLDDSYKENKPMEFNLADVIDGYAEGLMMMSIGSRYKFVIPPELAWGKKGSGGRIGPNAVVIFDVQLLEFW